MFHVSCELNFCYGHRLLNYPGKCRNLHGHNGRLIIVLEGDELDDQGMVQDFTHIKRVVGGWIDDHLDHRMILSREDPAVAVLEELGEPVFLIDGNPTAENIARRIANYAIGQGLAVTEVRLWETPKCVATYRPESSEGE